MRIIAALCFPLVVACITQPNYDGDIEANVELISKIELAQADLQKMIDDEDLFEKRRLRKELLSKIEREVVGFQDTLDRQSANTFLELVREGEPYDTTHVRFGMYRELLANCALQLRNLNHDLEYNLLPPDSVEVMVRREQLYANEVLMRIDTLKSEYQQEKLTSNQWLARVDTFEQKLTRK